jgi:hypothetical protein
LSFFKKKETKRKAMSFHQELERKQRECLGHYYSTIRIHPGVTPSPFQSNEKVIEALEKYTAGPQEVRPLAQFLIQRRERALHPVVAEILTRNLAQVMQDKSSFPYDFSTRSFPWAKMLHSGDQKQVFQSLARPYGMDPIFYDLLGLIVAWSQGLNRTSRQFDPVSFVSAWMDLQGTREMMERAVSHMTPEDRARVFQTLWPLYVEGEQARARERKQPAPSMDEMATKWFGAYLGPSYASLRFDRDPRFQDPSHVQTLIDQLVEPLDNERTPAFVECQKLSDQLNLAGGAPPAVLQRWKKLLCDRVSGTQQAPCLSELSSAHIYRPGGKWAKQVWESVQEKSGKLKKRKERA